MVTKPWGYYEDITRLNTIVFKKIVVKPQQKLSLQYHEKRSEFWYCYSGEGVMLVSDSRFNIKVGSYLLISPFEIHNVENTHMVDDLIIYELQFGECEEEDIVRLEDKYGRT